MTQLWITQIKDCAVEYGWKVDHQDILHDLVIGFGGDEHGIAYAIKTASGKGWLNVYFWYSNTYKSDAVYSLRTAGEVGVFIALLRDTYSIRSRRRIGK